MTLSERQTLLRLAAEIQGCAKLQSPTKRLFRISQEIVDLVNNTLEKD